MAIAQLSIDLIAKVASFEADLKRVARTAETQSERMAAAFGSAKGGLQGLFAGLSVGVVTAAFRGIVNGVDALNDLADATGSSVENLSALEDIAARTGTSMETVGGAVIKLNKTLADAKPGTDAAAALDALGLSAKELKTLDPAEALRRTAVALAGFADDGNKARLTQELFGKSLREVAPLLKDLATQGALNAKVTKEQADAAEKLNQNIFALQKNTLDLARNLSGPLVAALNDSFAAFDRIKKLNPATLFGQELQSEISSLQLLIARTKVEDLTIGLQKDPANTGLSTALQLAREDYERLSKAATAANEKLKATLGVPAALKGRPANEGGGGLASRGLPSLPDIVTPSKPSRPRTLEGAGLDAATISALQAIEGTDSAKIAKLNDTLDALFSIRASGVGGDRATDDAIAAVRDELAKLDPATAAAAKSAERLKAILAQTPTGELAAVLSDIELINKEFANGAKNTEQWAEAVKVATSKLGGAADEVEKLGTFAEQAGKNIQDALGDSLEQALSGNFASIGELWRNLIVKMAAQAAAAQLNNLLFGNTFGGSGDGAGIVGEGLKLLLSGARANGGPVSSGGAYLVGEQGPEIIVPRSSGMVIPNGGMGGTTVIQNVTINGDVSPGTVKLVEGAMSRVKADILRSSRTGGAYAGAY